MKVLEIAGTQYSPHIKMDPEAREIVIEGVSRPENTVEFFAPVLQWVNEYIDALRRSDGNVPGTTIRIDLTYFNSISAKYVASLILKCKQLYAEGEGLDVEWLYDATDEEAKGWGEDLAGIAGMEFRFREK